MFTEPLEAEIKAAGYIDAERKSRRTWVMAGCFVFLILAVLIMILTVIFENQFGMWPMAVAASFFTMFIIFLSVGDSLSILTDEARLMANQWQSFYQHLKDVTHRKAAIGRTNMFNRFLPYATYGLLHQWAKFFEKEGWTQLPPYFHALNRANDGGMAAFVAMTTSFLLLGWQRGRRGGRRGWSRRWWGQRRWLTGDCRFLTVSSSKN